MNLIKRGIWQVSILKNKKLMILMVLVLSLSLVLSACGGAKKTEEPKKEEPKAAETIKIAVIAPLTGNIATFGQSTKNAVQLLVDELNAKGGIDGKLIAPVFEDEKNDPVEGTNAVQKVITQDKVIGIIGSVASKVSLAMAPIAQSEGVVMISPTSTNDKLTNAGDYISRACFKDSFQGYVMAKFAGENLGAKKAAVLFDVGNDYSKGLAESFKANFGNFGGEVVAYESYGKDDQDFKALLTKIKGTKPDVLFVTDYYDKAALIAKQVKETKLNVKILGGDGFDSPDLVAIGGDAVEGVFFSNHYSPEADNPIAKKFIDAYQAKYGSVPDALAALAYDAGLMLFGAIDRADSLDPAKVKDEVVKTKDLDAVSGKITLDAERNPVKPAVIITIEKGKQKYVTQVNP